MPIKAPDGLRQLNYEEFAAAAYQVMEAVFSVHKEMGRLFDEVVYHKEIARRLKDARSEVAVEVSFGTFRKIYYLDLLFAGGALFEFKTVEVLTDYHRAQLLHYLLLLDLLHGKLVNMRPEAIEHEFVNAALTREDRIQFTVNDANYMRINHANPDVRDLFVPILRDWGTGLDISLYEEALTHFLGGEQQVVQNVGIFVDGNQTGNQSLRLAGPGMALKISALGQGQKRYEGHLRRFLAHTSLECMQWINVGRKVVTFKTLKR